MQSFAWGRPGENTACRAAEPECSGTPHKLASGPPGNGIDDSGSSEYPNRASGDDDAVDDSSVYAGADPVRVNPGQVWRLFDSHESNQHDSRRPWAYNLAKPA